MMSRTVDFQIRQALRDCYLEQLASAEGQDVPMGDAKALMFEILLGLFLATNDIGTQDWDRIEKVQNFKLELKRFSDGAVDCFTKELEDQSTKKGEENEKCVPGRPGLRGL